MPQGPADARSSGGRGGDDALIKLEVRHPGVLRTFFDPACMAIQSGSPPNDAAMPVAHGELTIQ
jgi:hypothetical protein